MARIRGITVTLYERTQTGKDAFGKDVYEETPVEVTNVLVAPTTADDIIDSQDLEGRKAVYTLAIPKGDTHTWENRRIDFFGKSWKSFGVPLQGIEANIPLDWNMKVTVERYE